MDYFQAYQHNGDYEQLLDLGLKTAVDESKAVKGWAPLGTVVVEEGREPEETDFQIVGSKPSTEVDVEVYSAPAQFWRFTIRRPEAEITRGAEGEKSHVAYGPRCVYVIQTGSGGFGEYWPSIRMVAGNMLVPISIGREQ